MAYEEERDEVYYDLLEDGFLGEVVRINKTQTSITEDPTETMIRNYAAMISLPASKGTIQAFDNRYAEDLRKGKIRFFMVAAKGVQFEIKSGDYLIAQNVAYEISGATQLKPSDTIIYYNIGAKATTRQDFNLVQVDPGNDNALVVGGALVYENVIVIESIDYVYSSKIHKDTNLSIAERIHKDTLEVSELFDLATQPTTQTDFENLTWV